MRLPGQYTLDMQTGTYGEPGKIGFQLCDADGVPVDVSDVLRAVLVVVMGSEQLFNKDTNVNGSGFTFDPATATLTYTPAQGEAEQIPRNTTSAEYYVEVYYANGTALRLLEGAVRGRGYR